MDRRDVLQAMIGTAAVTATTGAVQQVHAEDPARKKANASVLPQHEHDPEQRAEDRCSGTDSDRSPSRLQRGRALAARHFRSLPKPVVSLGSFAADFRCRFDSGQCNRLWQMAR